MSVYVSVKHSKQICLIAYTTSFSLAKSTHLDTCTREQLQMLQLCDQMLTCFNNSLEGGSVRGGGRGQGRVKGLKGVGYWLVDKKRAHRVHPVQSECVGSLTGRI